jgi:hypothetical protein
VQALVARADALVDPVAQFVGGDRRTGAQEYRGDRRFAPFFVGDAEDGDFAHRRMAHGDFFDVARVDLDAAAVDHVLLAVDQVEVALVVGIAEVAGEQPAVADRLLGEVGAAVVAEHQRRSAADDLADFARGGVAAVIADDAHLVEIRRRADRTGLAQRLRLVENGPETFGEPVEFVEAVRQQAIEQILVLLVERRPEREDHFQRSELARARSSAH